MKHTMVSIFVYGGYGTVEMYKNKIHVITGGRCKSYPVLLVIKCFIKLLTKIIRGEK